MRICFAVVICWRRSVLSFPERDDYLLAYATSQRHLMLHFVTTNRLPRSDRCIRQSSGSTGCFDRSKAQRSQGVARVGGYAIDGQRANGWARRKPIGRLFASKHNDLPEKLCEAFPSVPEYQALLATCQDGLVCSNRASSIGNRPTRLTDQRSNGCKTCWSDSQTIASTS